MREPQRHGADRVGQSFKPSPHGVGLNGLTLIGRQTHIDLLASNLFTGWQRGRDAIGEIG